MPPKIKADIKSLDFEEVLEAIGKGNYKDDAKVIRRAFGQTRRNVAAADAAAARGQVPNRANTSSPSAYSPSGLSAPNPVYPTGPASPSAAATMTTNDQAQQIQDLAPRKPPFFFREDYAGFIVKGNFMTLAARPHLVEQGEWLAHQIVEQNRTLGGMLLCVQEKDRSTGRSTCCDQTCPAMTAGPTTYMWIDTKGNPINLPAPQYIKNIQTWVIGKITDRNIFPTDNFTTAPPLPRQHEMQADMNHWLGKTSGFPQRFETEVKNMYKQMFRVYAHLYWQHWLAFWELSAHRELNTCFVHFINVGRIYNLLSDKDMEPMQPLVDLWVKSGVLPRVVQEPGVAGGGNGSVPMPVGPTHAPSSGSGSATTPASASAEAT